MNFFSKKKDNVKKKKRSAINSSVNYVKKRCRKKDKLVDKIIKNVTASILAFTLIDLFSIKVTDVKLEEILRKFEEEGRYNQYFMSLIHDRSSKTTYNDSDKLNLYSDWIDTSSGKSRVVYQYSLDKLNKYGADYLSKINNMDFLISLLGVPTVSMQYEKDATTDELSQSSSSEFHVNDVRFSLDSLDHVNDELLNEYNTQKSIDDDKKTSEFDEFFSKQGDVPFTIFDYLIVNFNYVEDDNITKKVEYKYKLYDLNNLSDEQKSSINSLSDLIFYLPTPTVLQSTLNYGSFRYISSNAYAISNNVSTKFTSSTVELDDVQSSLEQEKVEKDGDILQLKLSLLFFGYISIDSYLYYIDAKKVTDMLYLRRELLEFKKFLESLSKEDYKRKLKILSSLKFVGAKLVKDYNLHDQASLCLYIEYLKTLTDRNLEETALLNDNNLKTYPKYKVK